jgi:hypothetical protein
MATKYITIFQSRVLQNWDFCFEKKPSGNPAKDYGKDNDNFT